MFAYCLNNPIAYFDFSGSRPKYLPIAFCENKDESGRTYITDQDHQTIADLRFGVASISHSGCGIVASYNALITLGNGRDFEEVLAYYNGNILKTIGWGAIGLLPFNIAGYFEELGYSVVVTGDRTEIDQLSQTADACIMYYEFSRTYNFLRFLSIDAFGAHFIEYHKTQNGYTGLNTSSASGVSSFASPSKYGYQGNCFYAVGIFIFK